MNKFKESLSIWWNDRPNGTTANDKMWDAIFKVIIVLVGISTIISMVKILIVDQF